MLCDPFGHWIILIAIVESPGQIVCGFGLLKSGVVHNVYLKSALVYGVIIILCNKLYVQSTNVYGRSALDLDVELVSYGLQCKRKSSFFQPGRCYTSVCDFQQNTRGAE